MGKLTTKSPMEMGSTIAPTATAAPSVNMPQTNPDADKLMSSLASNVMGNSQQAKTQLYQNPAMANNPIAQTALAKQPTAPTIQSSLANYGNSADSSAAGQVINGIAGNPAGGGYGNQLASSVSSMFPSSGAAAAPTAANGAAASSMAPAAAPAAADAAVPAATAAGGAGAGAAATGGGAAATGAASDGAAAGGMADIMGSM